MPHTTQAGRTTCGDDLRSMLPQIRDALTDHHHGLTEVCQHRDRRSCTHSVSTAVLHPAIGADFLVIIQQHIPLHTGTTLSIILSWFSLILT